MLRNLPKSPLQWQILLLIISQILHTSNADIGTASKYSAPYSPTACNGGDRSQFPASNLFGAAGDGIWENGAACGRQYSVRCFSASKSDACVTDHTIQITIVDYALRTVSPAVVAGTTMILSATAYNAIVNSSSSVQFVTVEFQQA